MSIFDKFNNSKKKELENKEHEDDLGEIYVGEAPTQETEKSDNSLVKDDFDELDVKITNPQSINKESSQIPLQLVGENSEDLNNKQAPIDTIDKVETKEIPQEIEKKKFNFNLEKISQGAKNIVKKVEDTVHKVEDKIDLVGEVKKETSEEIKELNLQFERLRQKVIGLEKDLENYENSTVNNGQTTIVLSENLDINLLINKMEQSNSFMKQIALYLRNEMNSIVSQYIEENMLSIVQRIKHIKLEELNAQNSFKITLSDLEEKLTGKKKELIIIDNNISSKSSKLEEIDKQIQNEEKTLENITEESNNQNKALIELRKNVEQEESRIVIRLENYKKEQLVKVESEISEYRNNQKEKLKENIDLELEIQIEEKMKAFELLFKDLSSEMKNQILDKMLKKEEL